MMQKNILKYMMKNFLLISILICSTYCCNTGGTMKRVNKIHTNAAVYTWLVAIDDSPDDFFAIAYGSLIHPKAVLTGGVDLSSKPAENYYAEKDCDLDDDMEMNLFNCTTRTVSKIMYQDKQSKLENTWALVILEKPFDISPITAPINLANDINDIITDYCFFTRWMREDDMVRDVFGLVTEHYDTTFHNGKFDVHNLNINQLRLDRDWIVGEKFHEPQIYNVKDIVIPLNFIGSPLTCALHDEKTFVQVGIATFQLLIRYYPDDPLKNNITGSFIYTMDSYDEIMKKLNENV